MSYRDELIGKQFPVLDKGYVHVVDLFGDDQRIVNAARVSYGKGTKHIRENRGLIRYLMRHHHTSPFEQCVITLGIKCPMDVWRQWIRHRTAAVNEYSTRYSVAIDDTMITEPWAWRAQSSTNKQGSGQTLPMIEGEVFSRDEQKLHEYSKEIYKTRIDAGIAREQARKDLPLSTYTEAYWTINLHNLLHFLELRMDRHAQEEIRTYADVIADNIVAFWVPESWEAFCDYRLHAIHLSVAEQGVVSQMIGVMDTEEVENLIKMSGGELSKREATELSAKLKNMRTWVSNDADLSFINMPGDDNE